MVLNKIDTCIFCGQAPCECNRPSNKATPKKQAKRVRQSDKPDKADEPDKSDKPDKEDKAGQIELEEPQRKTSFADAMRAKAAQAPAPPPPAPPKPVLRKRAVNLDVAMFEAAVRALAPLLAPVERERYAAILTSEPTLEEKRLVWKARRNEQSGAGAEDQRQG